MTAQDKEITSMYTMEKPKPSDGTEGNRLTSIYKKEGDDDEKDQGLDESHSSHLLREDGQE